MNVLIIGGSGFLSGTMVRRAIGDGHQVWAVTRGQKILPAGAHAIVADRNDPAAFAAAIGSAAVHWDLAIDCIGFTADHARQDLEVLAGQAGHLVFISTDSTLSPVDRPWQVDETYDRFDDTEYARGKRAAELVLLASASKGVPFTILRPGHIYGPGSLLGCLPMHGRDPQLIEKLLRGDTLKLIGGGHFLQTPILAADLWEMAFSCMGNAKAVGEIFMAPGPDVIECKVFYRIIAQTLGVGLTIKEVSITDDVRDNPGHRMFCCHRVYSTTKAKLHGLKLATTPVTAGLPIHVKSMREGK